MLSYPFSLLWFSISPSSPEINTKSLFYINCEKSFLSKQMNFGMKWHCKLRNSCKAFMFMSPFNISRDFSKHFLVFKAQEVEILMFYKCLCSSFNFRVIYSCVKQGVLSFFCVWVPFQQHSNAVVSPWFQTLFSKLCWEGLADKYLEFRRKPQHSPGEVGLNQVFNIEPVSSTWTSFRQSWNVQLFVPADLRQFYNRDRSSFLCQELIWGFSCPLQGYFGKGILSRSRPVFSISDPQLVAKWRGKRGLFDLSTALLTFSHSLKGCFYKLHAES